MLVGAIIGVIRAVGFSIGDGGETEGGVEIFASVFIAGRCCGAGVADRTPRLSSSMSSFMVRTLVDSFR